MNFGSVCSGIEAASVAWAPLGWQAAWVAEIEPFPCAVLANHYPTVPNLGDMTTIARKVLTGEVPAPDVFCGGTPCQAFSVAGLRQSLSDERGNLSLKFVELADAIDHVRGRAGKPATIVFWENVPGVLSTKDNAFGCFLAGLAGEDEPLQLPGKRWEDAGAVYGPKRAIAWRTLDAQYFGLAQRRRRVFVVASARDGFDPAQVLFEWDGVRRDSAPSRKAGEVAAPCVTAGAANGGAAHGARSGSAKDNLIVPHLAACLTRGTGLRYDTDTDTILPVVAHSLRGEGFDASEDGTGRGTPLVPVHCRDLAGAITSNYGKQVDNSDTALGPNVIAFNATDYQSGAFEQCDAAGPLTTSADRSRAAPIVTAFSSKDHGADATDDLAPTLRAMNHSASHANGGGQMAVAVGVDAYNGALSGDVAATMGTRGSSQTASGPQVMQAMQVRRLTPEECEALQGFRPGYTRISWRGRPPEECPDGPRYKALGNSWAVPCVTWIGWRIASHLQAIQRRAA